MLIARVLYLAMLTAPVAMAIYAAWRLFRRWSARKRAQRWARYEPVVPAVTVRGASGPWRVHVARWLPVAALFGGGAVATGLCSLAHDVWVVTDGDHGPTVSRRVYLGDAAALYGARASGYTFAPSDAWVVNESSRVLHVEHTVYGGLATLPARFVDPMTLAPGTTAPVDFIDDIGPDHESPPSIMASHSTPMTRAWLTWAPHAGR